MRQAGNQREEAQANLATEGMLSMVCLVRQAAQALAVLDAERLESLAASLGALAHGAGQGQLRAGTERESMRVQGKELQSEIDRLASVLAVTRANLHVMRHADALARGSAGYGPQGGHCQTTERFYGNN